MVNFNQVQKKPDLSQHFSHTRACYLLTLFGDLFPFGYNLNEGSGASIAHPSVPDIHYVLGEKCHVRSFDTKSAPRAFLENRLTENHQTLRGHPPT